MTKCARCGKYIQRGKALTAKEPVPHYALGIQLLCTGYEVHESARPVCSDCYEASRAFMQGQATEAVQRFDRCPDCGKEIDPHVGVKFCSSCGAKIRISGIEGKFPKYPHIDQPETIEVVNE